MLKSGRADQGRVVYDHSKPDGTPRKLLDVSKLKALGWTAHIELEDGIRSVYANLASQPWY